MGLSRPAAVGGKPESKSLAGVASSKVIKLYSRVAWNAMCSPIERFLPGV